MSTSMPAKILMLAICSVDARIRLNVLDRTLVIQSIGESQILGMVGDGHVFVAMCAGGLGHFFDGVAAVGLHGVHVHIALQVGLRD